MNVWTSVKVITADHPRFGKAGVVFANNPATPLEVAVKFDTDGVVEIVALADLVAL